MNIYDHSMEKRTYTLRKRAEAQDETRARIVEAAVALHEELGPARTTISAIAERAGVQRLTVYRHFPDEVALIAACSAHWLEDNPLPDPAAWESIADGPARTEAALLALFGYYRRTARMWTVVYRDRAEVAAIEEPLRKFEDRLAAIQRGVAAAWGPAARHRTVKAALSHCLRFGTWQSLAQQGQLPQAEAASACVRWIEALVARAAAAR
jgi:AcrR family transcriptional regulator